MTLALLLTAVGGAWATEFTSLKVGDVLHVGDVINTSTNYSFCGQTLDANFQPATLVRANTSTWDITESETGAYYLLKDQNGTYYGYILGPMGYEGGYWPVTDTSDGISVTAITPDGSYRDLTFAVHEPEITEWSLTPDETGKTWTLAKMPASNVELQVEYFAESNLFLSKDALADKTNIAVKAGDLGVQFGDDGKSANTITEGTPMTVTYNGTKKVIGVKVEKKATVDPAKAYMKWDADQKKLVATEIPTEVTTVANADAGVEWQAGTYVVEGQVTINGGITLNGKVDLIIKDGAKLTAKQIIGKNNYLSIYGQANQTGQLVVDNSGDDATTSIKSLEVHSAKVTATSSKKDRGGFYYTGTINVYGGSVDATAANGYGISLRSDGSMNIYGGEVKAVGKGNGNYGYGIEANSTSTVTVNGGKLWAENADKKAINTSLITLKKGAGFTGKIEYSSDKSTWSETVDANAKYVRAGY